MSAGHACVRTIDLAHASESVWLAAERMHQRGVGALVVVNEAQEPVGILTDRDLVERVLTKRLDPDETLVGQVMSRHPETIDERASIESALERMRDGHFRRLPVVDPQGKMAGLLCLDDVLMHWAREFAVVGQLLQTETPRVVAEVSLAATH